MKDQGSRIASSYRDPDSFAFWHDGDVYRALSRSQDEALHVLLQNDVQKRCISFNKVPMEAAKGLHKEHPDYEAFARVETVWPVVYPYEWSPSMLGAAGLFTLDLQLELIKCNLSLKDACASNVQFISGKPALMDIGSIERPERRDLWYAMGQFNRVFLFPLLLHRYHGWPISSYFLPFPEGIDVETMAGLLGRESFCLPRYFFDIGLPLLLSKWLAKRTVKYDQMDGSKASVPNAQRAMLTRLKRKLHYLGSAGHNCSAWSTYTTTCTYDAVAARAKKDIVKGIIQRLRPSTVLDVGCNTGDYSYIAAESGAKVLSCDADPCVIDALYTRLQSAPASICPAVVSLLNPTQALGAVGHEREGFLARGKADCVMALAVMHHLLVGGKLRLDDLADMFSRVARESLILEIVPNEDEMFESLTKFRKDSFPRVTKETVINAFKRHFIICEAQPVPHTGRTICLFKLRD